MTNLSIFGLYVLIVRTPTVDIQHICEAHQFSVRTSWYWLLYLLQRQYG